MEKKKAKQPLKHSDADMKRYIGSLAEHFDDRFDVVIEQFGGMNDKLDRHEKKLDSHAEMIAKMMVQLQEIQSDMKQKVDLQQFARLEKRVVMLEARAHR
jgi:predicted ATPase with chaperone activity